KVFFGKGAGTVALTDPLRGAAAGEAPSGQLEKIKINNRLRRAVRTAMGSLTLLSPDIAVRRAAVASVFQSGDPEAIPLIDAALGQEKEPGMVRALREARAAAVLKSDRPDEEKVAAVTILTERGTRDVMSVLLPLSG